MKGEPFWKRLADKIDADPDGCWDWLGARQSEGYGVIRVWGKAVYAHILMYILTNGPIPDGLEIDHLCRNRNCVNPQHLEAVTHRTNLLRGHTMSAMWAARTHCREGHELAGDNLRIRVDRSRACRTCERARQRNRAAMRREGVLG